MHVGPFLCQRGRCSLGSCLRLGIRLVCVIGARTVVAVIGAATGTFVAVVVGDGMVGARLFHIQMFTMRQTRALYALAGKTQRRCHTKSLGFQFHTLHPRIISWPEDCIVQISLLVFPDFVSEWTNPAVIRPYCFPIWDRLIPTAIIRHGADSFRGVPRSRPDLHGCSLRLRNLVIVREDVTVELGDEIVPIIMWVE